MARKSVMPARIGTCYICWHVLPSIYLAEYDMSGGWNCRISHSPSQHSVHFRLVQLSALWETLSRVGSDDSLSQCLLHYEPSTGPARGRLSQANLWEATICKCPWQNSWLSLHLMAVCIWWIWEHCFVAKLQGGKARNFPYNFNILRYVIIQNMKMTWGVAGGASSWRCVSEEWVIKW